MLSRQWFLLSKIVTLSVSKFEWSKHSPRAAFFENSKPPRMLMSVGLVLCFKAWARVIPFVCCCSSSRIFKTCFLETRRSFGVREGCTEGVSGYCILWFEYCVSDAGTMLIYEMAGVHCAVEPAGATSQRELPGKQTSRSAGRLMFNGRKCNSPCKSRGGM